MHLITRRTVLKYGSLAAASAVLSSALPRPVMARSLAQHPGLQLYTVGKELMADMPGTLAKVAAIGYRSVESAGMGGKSPTEFRRALDAAGLKCPSSHLFLMPGQSATQYLEGIRTLGSEYVVSSLLLDPSAPVKSVEDYIKYAAALTQDDFRKMAAGLNRLAGQARGLGLKFAYHNHNLEFRQWADGSTAYDTLMSETDPALVRIELDCGWAELGGRSPLDIFKRYQGRIRMLHIKDFVPVARPIVAMNENSSVEWTELGKGHMDYRTILAQAPQAGVERIFVEQEPPYVKYTALEAARVDFEYLRSIG